MRRETQLFVPTFAIKEVMEEIQECLTLGWTGMGFKTLEFERAWQKYTGHRHAFFLNSATSGLNLALYLLKDYYHWNDESEIITTGLTFVSTNHAILHAQLKPVFADVDQSLNLSLNSVKSKISKKTKAVIFVGLGGNATNLDKISKLCNEKGIKLILDAAHMSGTKLNGRTPGLLAEVTVYSFQAVKNLPTADSGMICFNNLELDHKARKVSWLGINKDTYSRFNDNGNYKWLYDVESIGFKYHGNSIMAAIALVQLRYLEKDNFYRRWITNLYDQKLKSARIDFQRPHISKDCLTSGHLYQIIIENRDGLIDYMHKKQIYPGVHYIDNSTYHLYDYPGSNETSTRYYSSRILSLPLHLRLIEEDIDIIVNCIREFQNSTRDNLI